MFDGRKHETFLRLQQHNGMVLPRIFQRVHNSKLLLNSSASSILYSTVDYHKLCFFKTYSYTILCALLYFQSHSAALCRGQSCNICKVHTLCDRTQCEEQKLAIFQTQTFAVLHKDRIIVSVVSKRVAARSLSVNVPTTGRTAGCALGYNSPKSHTLQRASIITRHSVQLQQACANHLAATRFSF